MFVFCCLFFVCFFCFFFFFQAEDGIRDRDVTGVQTCALPISIVRTMRPAALNTRAITGDAIGRSRLISARPDVGVGRGLPSTTAGGGVPEGTPVMVVGMNVATFEYELQREEASELRSTA